MIILRIIITQYIVNSVCIMPGDILHTWIDYKLREKSARSGNVESAYYIYLLKTQSHYTTTRNV